MQIMLLSEQRTKVKQNIIANTCTNNKQNITIQFK
jgi:hypothetical protein